MTWVERIAVLLGLADDEALLDGTDNGQPVSHEQRQAAPREANLASSAAGDFPGLANPRHSVTVRPAPRKPLTIKPQNKDDLRKAIDALRTGQSVIIDGSHVPSDLRYRMLDFLSGGCSAVTARMEKIARGVFLLDPTPAPRG
jgi:FtsZ-interacting cell division protein YlmF